MCNRGLGVGEVWVQRKSVLKVHVLSGDAYVERASSALLPALDLDLAAPPFRVDEDQTPLVKVYRAELRARVASR